MSLIELFKKITRHEVKCALCLARVPRHTTIELYETEICDWCVNYYSKIFPDNWKDKIRTMIVLYKSE